MATLSIPIFEPYYEYYFGIHSSGMKVSKSKDYFHYQGATYFALLKVMREIKKYANSYTFMDIGCGKGRAMIVAEYFGFRKISGIELDKDLLEMANRNIVVRKRPITGTEFKLQHINALEMQYLNEPTVYFLFNPFSREVLDGVLKKICEQNKQRNIFIYMNPTAREAFHTSHFKLIKEIRTRNYTEAIVFEQLILE